MRGSVGASSANADQDVVASPSLHVSGERVLRIPVPPLPFSPFRAARLRLTTSRTRKGASC